MRRRCRKRLPQNTTRCPGHTHHEVLDIVDQAARALGLPQKAVDTAYSLVGLLPKLMRGCMPPTRAAVAVAIAINPPDPRAEARAVATACGIAYETLRNWLKDLVGDAAARAQLAQAVAAHFPPPPSWPAAAVQPR